MCFPSKTSVPSDIDNSKRILYAWNGSPGKLKNMFKIFLFFAIILPKKCWLRCYLAYPSHSPNGRGKKKYREKITKKSQRVRNIWIHIRKPFSIQITTCCWCCFCYYFLKSPYMPTYCSISNKQFEVRRVKFFQKNETERKKIITDLNKKNKNRNIVKKTERYE